MAYDLGDVATLSIQIKDANGTLANATTVVATVTAPDGSTSTPSVTNGSTGNYSCTFTATLVGRHSIRWVATGTNAGAYTDVFDILDPALLPIVSLSDLKAHLTIPSTDTSKDEALRYTLAQATDIAERYCNRALRRKTITETHTGLGRIGINLYKTPVISITSVTENGTTLPATAYSCDLDAGVIYRGSYPGANWWSPTQSYNVTVTYVAGYTDPPLVAQRAVLDIARWMWQRTGQGPRPGFGQSADMADYGTDALPSWLMRPLDSLAMPGIA